VPTRELTNSLDAPVFQFLKLPGFRIINLDGIDLFIVDGDFGLKMNGPTGRFSPDGYYADELTYDGYLLCSRLCLQAHAKKH
jgi:hypothetical protein